MRDDNLFQRLSMWRALFFDSFQNFVTFFQEANDNIEIVQVRASCKCDRES